MKARERINTRKIALAAEFGFDASDVTEDGFDEDGFTVLTESLGKLSIPNVGMRQILMSDMMPLTKILWPNTEWRQRGLAARNDDFAEEVGPEAMAGIRELQRSNG